MRWWGKLFVPFFRLCLLFKTIQFHTNTTTFFGINSVQSLFFSIISFVLFLLLNPLAKLDNFQTDVITWASVTEFPLPLVRPSRFHSDQREQKFTTKFVLSLLMILKQVECFHFGSHCSTRATAMDQCLFWTIVIATTTTVAVAVAVAASVVTDIFVVVVAAAADMSCCTLFSFFIQTICVCGTT